MPKLAACQTGGMSPASTAELKDSDPVIWRQVEVPTSIALTTLHNIIQVAIGWCDYHR